MRYADAYKPQRYI